MSLDVYLTEIIPTEIYRSNITHNMGEMAEAAGIYKACWRPEEIGVKFARDIIPLLEKGIEDMKSRPEHYEKFNPSNGWGSYKRFLPWLEKYLAACKEHPDAEISVSR